MNSNHRHLTRNEFRILVTREDGSRYTEWRLTQEAVDKFIAALKPGFSIHSVALVTRELDW